jgi:hypothetical protein
MKKHFETYLHSLGITKPILKRAESVLSFHEAIVSSPIKHVFVSEYVNDEKVRTYESLFIFSETSIMEASQFVSEDAYEWAPFPKSIVYWELKKKDFDLKAATEKSRLSVTLRLPSTVGLLSGLSVQLKASGNNCDHLFPIFTQFILPRCTVPK